MSKSRYTVFTVEPERGAPFPLDMLRYDCCYPNSTDDAAHIHRSISDRASRPITLVTQRAPEFVTADRWKSFGWIVSNIERR